MHHSTLFTVAIGLLLTGNVILEAKPGRDNPNQKPPETVQGPLSPQKNTEVDDALHHRIKDADNKVTVNRHELLLLSIMTDYKLAGAKQQIAEKTLKRKIEEMKIKRKETWEISGDDFFTLKSITKRDFPSLTELNNYKSQLERLIYFPSKGTNTGYQFISQANKETEQFFEDQLRERSKLLKEKTKDKGDNYLKALREERREIVVNDANWIEPNTSAYLVNCGLCTLGAIQGKSSGKMANEIPPYRQDLQTNDDLFDVNAQFNKLRDSLKRYAQKNRAFRQEVSQVPGKRFAEGDVPGYVNQPQLIEQMNAFKNGSRFAVKVVDADGGQAHWVYAEKYDGTLIFEDYQHNLMSEKMERGKPTGKARVYQERVTINSFPRHPLTGEPVFEQGLFIALPYN